MTSLNQTEINKIFDITKIITLFTKQLPPVCACEEEMYDFWQLKYLYEGERSTIIDGVVYRAMSGQVLFHPPNIPHSSLEEMNRPCKIGMISFVCSSPLMFSFSNKLFTLKPKEEKLLLDIFEWGSPIFKWFTPQSGKRGMYATNNAEPAQLYRLKLKMELFLTNLYTEYNGTTGVGDLKTAKKRNQNKELFISVVKYLEENIDCSLTVEDIANACDISVPAIKKLFKEETDNGVIRYFNHLKIKAAMKMIRETSLSFSQISDALGFSSPLYFSRMFKNILGESPMEYSKSVGRMETV